MTDGSGAGAATADEKSPKSAPKLSLRAAVVRCCCEGGDVGFGGGVGFMSKKLPPLSEDLAREACREWPVGDVRPEKGAAFG